MEKPERSGKFITANQWQPCFGSMEERVEKKEREREKGGGRMRGQERGDGRKDPLSTPTTFNDAKDAIR